MAFVLLFPPQTDRERTRTSPLQKLSLVVLVCQNNDRCRSGSDDQNKNTLPYLTLMTFPILFHFRIHTFRKYFTVEW